MRQENVRDIIQDLWWRFNQLNSWGLGAEMTQGTYSCSRSKTFALFNAAGYRTHAKESRDVKRGTCAISPQGLSLWRCNKSSLPSALGDTRLSLQKDHTHTHTQGATLSSPSTKQPKTPAFCSVHLTPCLSPSRYFITPCIYGSCCHGYLNLTYGQAWGLERGSSF